MLVIKLFTGLFKHFGIWAVGTAGENCLHGPDKHLKSKKNSVCRDKAQWIFVSTLMII